MDLQNIKSTVSEKFRALGRADKLAVLLALGAAALFVIAILATLLGTLFESFNAYGAASALISVSVLLSSIAVLLLLCAFPLFIFAGPKRRAAVLGALRLIFLTLRRLTEVRPEGYEEADQRKRKYQEAQQAAWNVRMEMSRSDLDAYITAFEESGRQNGMSDGVIIMEVTQIERSWTEGMEERAALARQRENRERQQQGLDPLPEQPGDAELLERFMQWQQAREEEIREQEEQHRAELQALKEQHRAEQQARNEQRRAEQQARKEQRRAEQQARNEQRREQEGPGWLGLIFRRLTDVQARPGGHEEADQREREYQESRQAAWNVRMEMSRSDLDAYITAFEESGRQNGMSDGVITMEVIQLERSWTEGMEERAALARQRENRERRQQGLAPLPEQPGDAELLERFLQWQQAREEESREHEEQRRAEQQAREEVSREREEQRRAEQQAREEQRRAEQQARKEQREREQARNEERRAREQEERRAREQDRRAREQEDRRAREQDRREREQEDRRAREQNRREREQEERRAREQDRRERERAREEERRERERNRWRR